jgi:GNAT superfamily N-acetyltransferase
MHVKIAPFSGADLEEASELLAHRHQGDRAHDRALPERFTHPLEARAAIEQTWKASTVKGISAGGVVARQNGRMIGYLIGVPKIDESWGRSVWVELAGHAINHPSNAELYRDLYAALSPSWVALGCLAHYALIPSSDQAALEAWFNLSFGKEHVHAIRETAPASTFDAPIDPTLEIRRAGPADLDASVALDDIIPIHQSRAPVYSSIWPYDREEARQEALESLNNPEEKLWLAFRDGRIVSYQFYIPISSRPQIGELTIPEHCSYLAFAVTREEEQGRGVGRILTAHGIAEEHATGFTHCITDWRATNLLSSRFWPRQGFRPVAYRLSRRLDERILWGHANASPLPWLGRRLTNEQA